MEENIVLRYVDLPHSIRAITLLDSDGFYNVYINARLNAYMRRKAYEHELEHIRRGDWESDLPVWYIEMLVREKISA